MAALALIAGMTIAVQRAMPALAPGAAGDQDRSQGADSKNSESRAAQAGESEKDQGKESARNAKVAEAQSQSAAKKPRTGDGRSIPLNLIIAGLGKGGCDVEVKPGNAGCKFRAVDDQGKEGRQHVSSDGRARLILRDVEVRGADRTCTVAITIFEVGCPAKTVKRGFRFAPPTDSSKGSAPVAPSGLTFYLKSPAKIAKADDGPSRKISR
jgi:hypothetical protein